MTRKRKKDRKAKGKSGLSGYLPGDVEHCVVAAPVAEAEAHELLRDRVFSRKWWVFLGFKSEAKVGKVLERLRATSDDTELVEWPVVRIGEVTGRKEDEVLFLLIKKSTLPSSLVFEVLLECGARSVITAEAGRDIIPLSWGYVITLMNLLDNLLKQGTHVNN